MEEVEESAVESRGQAGESRGRGRRQQRAFAKTFLGTSFRGASSGRGNEGGGEGVGTHMACMPLSYASSLKPPSPDIFCWEGEEAGWSASTFGARDRPWRLRRAHCPRRRSRRNVRSSRAVKPAPVGDATRARARRNRKLRDATPLRLRMRHVSARRRLSPRRTAVPAIAAMARQAGKKRVSRRGGDARSPRACSPPRRGRTFGVVCVCWRALN